MGVMVFVEAAVQIDVDLPCTLVDGGNVGPRNNYEIALAHRGPGKKLRREKSCCLVPLNPALHQNGGAGFGAAQPMHGKRILSSLEKGECLTTCCSRPQQEQRQAKTKYDASGTYH
eukprot:TRINITY_DN12725_c0_g1_i2.p2 TRINITY_DN12725_c0_g1~~TRINITY_DN12725_c0_g1_i2.p2  ORF type:complete len:116 (-),score=17.55 TRINITY_DN12725_c0_g1_i2:131-478(-)